MDSSEKLQHADSENSAKSSIQVSESKKTSSKLNWEFDSERNNCASCNLVFSLTIRRHHCRSCGKIFCHQCCPIRHFENDRGKLKERNISGVEALVPSPKSQRLCDTCVNQDLYAAREALASEFSPSLVDNEEVAPLTFEVFWSVLGVYECSVIDSSLAAPNIKLHNGELKEKLQKGLFFISGVNNIPDTPYKWAPPTKEGKQLTFSLASDAGEANMSYSRYLRFLYHGGHGSLQNTDVKVMIDYKDLKGTSFDDLKNKPEVIKQLNMDIPEDMSHFLQLFVLKKGDVSSLLLNGYMKYFFQFRNIVKALPTFLSNIDYTNAYMLQVFEREFPNFMSAFGQFADLNRGQVLEDISSEYNAKIGVARCVRMKAHLIPEKFKNMYPLFMKFLESVDCFSIDVFERISMATRNKTKRKAISLAWSKSDSSLMCEFIKAGDSLLYSHRDDRPIEDSTKEFLRSSEYLSHSVNWKKGEKYFMKVHLRLNVPVLSFLNRFTSNSVFFELRVIDPAGEFEIKFKDVDGLLGSAFKYFFPNAVKEFKKSFQFKATVNDPPEKEDQLKSQDNSNAEEKSKADDKSKTEAKSESGEKYTLTNSNSALNTVSGSFSTLTFCASGIFDASGHVGGIVASLLFYLWSQFILTEALFEALYLAQDLLSALVKDIVLSKRNSEFKSFVKETLPLKADRDDSMNPDLNPNTTSILPKKCFVNWTRKEGDHELSLKATTKPADTNQKDVSTKSQGTPSHEANREPSSKTTVTPIAGEFGRFISAQWLHRPSPNLPPVKEDVVIKVPRNHTDPNTRTVLLHEANMLWYAQSQGVGKFVSDSLCVVEGEVTVDNDGWAKHFNIRMTENRIGLVLKNEPGGDLETHLKQVLTYLEKIEILKSISEALWHVHSAGIVHGNIAMKNILLSQSKHPHIRLADFTLARAVNNELSVDSSKKPMMTDKLRGIPQYCAPELLPTSRENISILSESTYATDIYAFAILAWEVLSDKRALDAFTSLKAYSAAGGDAYSEYFRVADVVHRSYSCFCEKCGSCCNTKCSRCGFLCGSKVTEFVFTKCAHSNHIMNCSVCYTTDVKRQLDECKFKPGECACFSSKCDWHCGCREKKVPGNRPPINDIQIVGQAWTIKNLVTKCWLTKPSGRPDAATVRDVIQKEYERVNNGFNHIFLSFASENSGTAAFSELFRLFLIRKGYKVWYGSSKDSYNDQIARSEVVVAVVCQPYTQSEVCALHLKRASELCRPIVSVVIQKNTDFGAASDWMQQEVKNVKSHFNRMKDHLVQSKFADISEIVDVECKDYWGGEGTQPWAEKQQKPGTLKSSYISVDPEKAFNDIVDSKFMQLLKDVKCEATSKEVKIL